MSDIHEPFPDRTTGFFNNLRNVLFNYSANTAALLV